MYSCAGPLWCYRGWLLLLPHSLDINDGVIALSRWLRLDGNEEFGLKLWCLLYLVLWILIGKHLSSSLVLLDVNALAHLNTLIVQKFFLSRQLLELAFQQLL